MSEKDRNLVQVVTLDKNDIILIDVGRLSIAQEMPYIRKIQKTLSWRHRGPMFMPIREAQGLTIIKRPYAEENLELYSEEAYEARQREIAEIEAAHIVLSKRIRDELNEKYDGHLLNEEGRVDPKDFKRACELTGLY